MSVEAAELLEEEQLDLPTHEPMNRVAVLRMRHY